MNIASYDLDGVIYMGPNLPGVYPGPLDIIITGRSFEEEPETNSMLRNRGIQNIVFFNPLKFDEKSRESSGEHKAWTLNRLKNSSKMLAPVIHFEDDEVQAAIIEARCPWIKVVKLVHNLTEKENIRHDKD